MTEYPFTNVIEDSDTLRNIMGTPSELVVRKQLDYLDGHARRFIARSPFVLVGSSSQHQMCDVSPRGDAAGFVLVVDDHTLVIPERPGNRRLDTLTNVMQTGAVGLLFLVPGVEETLRVNGQARVICDAQLLNRMTVQGKKPLLALGIKVQECYFHCAKAFKRSRLWEPENWPDREGLATLAQILLDQTQPANTSLQDLEGQITQSYKTRLY